MLHFLFAKIEKTKDRRLYSRVYPRPSTRTLDCRLLYTLELKTLARPTGRRRKRCHNDYNIHIKHY